MNNELLIKFQDKIADELQWAIKNNISERTTKAVFIEPYLDLLGYDSKNMKRFIREFKIGPKAVDYALFDNDYSEGDTPVLIIEAKKIDVNIDMGVVTNQLKNYFNSLEGCKYGILTNGRQYNIYTDSNSPGIMDEKPIVKFIIDKTHVDTHKTLSCPALYNSNTNFLNIMGAKEKEEALVLLRSKWNGRKFIDFLLEQSTSYIEKMSDTKIGCRVNESELIELLNDLFNKENRVENILVLNNDIQPELKISNSGNHYSHYKEFVRELYPPGTKEHIISKGIFTRTIETAWDVLYVIASYGVFSPLEIEDTIRNKLEKKFYVSNIGTICSDLSKEGILLEYSVPTGIRKSKVYSLTKQGAKYIEETGGIKPVASKLNEHLDRSGKVDHSFVTEEVMDISKGIFNLEDVEIVYKFKKISCIPYIKAKKDGQNIFIQVIDERFLNNSEAHRVNQIISNYDKAYFISPSKDDINKFIYYASIVEENYDFPQGKQKTVYYTNSRKYMKNEYIREVVIENKRAA